MQSGEIFQEWDLYARIVHENWMRHREMQQAIQTVAARWSDDRPDKTLRVLDLGCGDGSMACQGFIDSDIDQYVGVDLSADALEKLSQRSGPGLLRLSRSEPSSSEIRQLEKQLHVGDLAMHLKQLPGDHFDMVLASYSLHHFQMDQKQNILSDIARVLRPGGRFVWIDIVRDPGEQRSDYVMRIELEIKDRWIPMPAADQLAAIEHIRTCDFPETEPWMVERWQELNSGEVERLFRDPLYGCWSMHKS
ncbi:MAG: class I SAM-dependent methyltransferase [Planctomycetota bacterium]